MSESIKQIESVEKSKLDELEKQINIPKFSSKKQPPKKSATIAINTNRSVSGNVLDISVVPTDEELSHHYEV
jgi:hypothetical protein